MVAERPTNEYLRFTEEPSTSGKTVLVRIYSVSADQMRSWGDPADELGFISWWAPWRQYTFRPSPHTIWNTGCLATVQEYIATLMAERTSA